jgi:plasmid replication initiation protein
MDRRKTQISLPLNLPEKEFKDNVKQHWNITFSRQGKISVYGKRIMALVLAQIQENENKLKPFYHMDVSDIMRAGEIGGKSAYQEAKKALDELARQIWSIEDVENEIYRPKQLINTSTLESKEGFEYGYKNGVITIVLNPALEPYFVEMSHYSRYELKNYMKFKSWYSMRFWEILSAYQDTGKWVIPLAEYRKLMDCEKKYKDVNLMIRKTTAEPLEELKGTELEFSEPTKVFAKYHGKGRPPVVGLEFKLVRSLLNDDEILSDWAKHSPEHARMIGKLHNDWKITQACLRKYLPEIKMEGARKLLRQFEQMESIGTKRKIDSKEKYCNSAIKRMAEEIKKGKEK